MDWISSVVLGVVQGLTEFLPVSSSGHLLIFGHWLPGGEQTAAFDVTVHVATLVAVLWVYRQKYTQLATEFINDCRAVGHDKKAWKDSETINLAIQVILATIPTGLIGYVMKCYLPERVPGQVVGGLLILTALILLLPKVVKIHRQLPTLKPWHFGVILGLAQSFAVLPGISRSGTTITIAVLLGASRQFAGLFSFLIMIPAVCGAMILHLNDVGEVGWLPLIAGFAAALISGVVALKLLLKLLANGQFWWFSPYCIALGVLAIVSM